MTKGCHESWLVWSKPLNSGLWIINLNLTSAPSWGVQKTWCPSFNLELSKQISLAHILIEHKITCSNQSKSALVVEDIFSLISLRHQSKNIIIGKPETKPSGKETGGIKFSLLALCTDERNANLGWCDGMFAIRVSIKQLPVPTSCDTLRHGVGGEKGKMYSWLDRRVIAAKEHWGVPVRVM